MELLVDDVYVVDRASRFELEMKFRSSLISESWLRGVTVAHIESFLHVP
jgi:hypothetical protein